MAAAPERYDCTRCTLRAQVDGLWQMNADAWRIYQLLSRRVVSGCELRAAVFACATDDWPAEDVIDVVQRLDVILEVLEPKL